jgi:hypothetical protein
MIMQAPTQGKQKIKETLNNAGIKLFVMAAVKEY